jgi:hypothetical protein
MIPRILYSTWISPNPIPSKYQKYIDSWMRVMPKYKIKIISLDNVKKTPFVIKAIEKKNFALAGHYARIQELYDNGGIYFDIDIEATKPLDSLLHNKFVLGIEDRWIVNNAVIISEKGHPFLKRCLEFMDAFDWKGKDIELETGPRMFTSIAKKHYGWECGKIGTFKDISILPPVYFYPYHYTEKYSLECVTPETFTVHHWSNSWNDRVSIVIPCYNQGRYLNDAVDSALAQTHKNIEVIVVNDGSTDNTKQVAQSYGKRIKYIEQDNKGLSAARNAGIKASSGGWILPLDSDDKFHPTFIEKTIGKADIVCTWLQCFDKSKDVWKSPKTNPTYSDFLKMNQIFCCSLFSKHVWSACGGYDEQQWSKGKQGCNGFEDWLFWLRATKNDFNVTVVPEILFYYRKNGQSMITDAMKNKSKILAYMRREHPGLKG